MVKGRQYSAIISLESDNITSLYTCSSMCQLITETMFNSLPIFLRPITCITIIIWICTNCDHMRSSMQAYIVSNKYLAS